MPYNKKEFKESNINYLNKDFSQYKDSLVKYVQSYFPDTYRDFNETSPGMMMLELNAYVGDVLSFYIDQQYKEMLLPLAEERRNVMNLAKMFGYKVKPIIPAQVELHFTSLVNASDSDSSKVNYANAAIFEAGIQVQSKTNSDIIFETLEPVDFTISSSSDTSTPSAVDSSTQLTSQYRLTRSVKAVSAETKTRTFDIGAPIKFRRLTLEDTDIVDIVSVVDTNGNNWYEVDYLAQDRLPQPVHYTEDVNRTSAYQNLDGSVFVTDVPVPYALNYIKTSKRFTRETNLDNTTSLIFGNGVLRQGKIDSEDFLDLQQVGIVVPGQTSDLNESIDITLGDEYSTLGEIPSQTQLLVTYRVGGGINANVSADDLIILPSEPSATSGDGTVKSIETVTNPIPAGGGRDMEELEEIRQKTMAFFKSQNRCVTKEDYEARVLNMSSKFGNIAKCYVTRNSVASQMTQQFIEPLQGSLADLDNIVSQQISALNQSVNSMETPQLNIETQINTLQNSFINMMASIDNAVNAPGNTLDQLDNQMTDMQENPPTIQSFYSELLNYENLLSVRLHENSQAITDAMTNFERTSVAFIREKLDGVQSSLTQLINTILQTITNKLLEFEGTGFQENPREGTIMTPGYTTDTRDQIIDEFVVFLKSLQIQVENLNIQTVSLIQAVNGQIQRGVLEDGIQIMTQARNYILQTTSFLGLPLSVNYLQNSYNINVSVLQTFVNQVVSYLILLRAQIESISNIPDNTFVPAFWNVPEELTNVITNLQGIQNNLTNSSNTIENSLIGDGGMASLLHQSLDTADYRLGNILVTLLSYDNRKNLIGNPWANEVSADNGVPHILKSNLLNYLAEFRILTDDIAIMDGYVINFGVFFEVVANKQANKAQVKLRCINKIREYFNVEDMHFNQPLNLSQIEYDLMEIDGVRAVSYVRLSQELNPMDSSAGFNPPLYSYSINPEDGTPTTDGGQSGYGYKYDFLSATTREGFIVPPSPGNPGVFELKNPNQNIIGVVK